MASCALIPMPLSVIVSVRASLSKVTFTFNSGSLSYRPPSLMASKRSLSQASEALETSSRRKISLLEYKEWVTRCSSCATSAWKERVCLVIKRVVVKKMKTRMTKLHGQPLIMGDGSGFQGLLLGRQTKPLRSGAGC